MYRTFTFVNKTIIMTDSKDSMVRIETEALNMATEVVKKSKEGQSLKGYVSVAVKGRAEKDLTRIAKKEAKNKKNK